MGHIRAAAALQASAERSHPDLDSRHINIIDYAPSIVGRILCNSYNHVVRYVPRLYGALYTLDDHKHVPLAKTANRCIRLALQRHLKRLIRDIDAFQPDRIVTTHYLVPYLLKNKISCPIDLVITDYYAHRVWLHDNVRTYFVAALATARRLQEQNKTVVVSGIPIHPDFLNTPSPALLKTKLGLDQNQPTLLLLSGGNGLIDTSIFAEQIIQHLPNANIVAIAGQGSPRLYQRLIRLQSTHPALQVFTFVDNIAEWTAVADLIVTKPGGLTVAEAIYLNKPLVLVNPIPGQETKNAAFVEQHHYGHLIKNNEALMPIIKHSLSTPPLPNTRPLPFPNDIIIDYPELPLAHHLS